MNEFKELRMRRRMTQEECAKALNVSKRTIQNLESESSDVTSDKFSYYLQSLKEFSAQGYRTNVVVGKSIDDLAQVAKGFRKRDCFKYLLGYLRNGYPGKVCILYGLRRTGKTTMIFQALSEVERSKAAYIKVQEGNTMADLIKDINALRALGIVYLFVDEVTLLADFVDTAATLSDVYGAIGMKIVLSGTDSLGFAFASGDELYDRALTIHTSYIPFGEFSRVLGIDDIDKYIEYGGTLKTENMGFDDPDYKSEEVAFRDDESTRKYIDTAICRNIQRTLQNASLGNRFGHLRELYEQGELTNAINRIIEDMNHEFLASVVTKTFKSHDLGSARHLLAHGKNEETQTALYSIDEAAVLSRLKEIVDIKEKGEQRVEMTQEIVGQIRQYLYELDLIKDVDVVYTDGTTRKRVVFSQPGMRYSITKALVYSLLQDAFFLSLSEKEKRLITQTILGDVKGRMLEDIVLLETSIRERKRKVFKYADYVKGEFDMVVFDPEADRTEVYEIKHSSAISFESQTKYMFDENLVGSLEKRFGPNGKRSVLYRGESAVVEGVEYQNVETFLKSKNVE